MRSKYEVKAQKELQSEGYLVDWKVRPGRAMRNYNTDFFNLFDLIAVMPGKMIRWISIKGTAGILKSHIQDIFSFKLPPNNQKEVWARSKGKSNYWKKVVIE